MASILSGLDELQSMKRTSRTEQIGGIITRFDHGLHTMHYTKDHDQVGRGQSCCQLGIGCRLSGYPHLEWIVLARQGVVDGLLG